MNETEIKEALGIKDWRISPREIAGKLLPLLQDATPETIKSILNQIPNLTDVIKEMNLNAKEYCNTVLVNSKNVTQQTIDSINNVINNIQKIIETDMKLTAEDKNKLIEKEMLLLDKIIEVNKTDKQFMAFIAKHYKEIALGGMAVVGSLFLCLTPSGKDILKGVVKAFSASKDVAKIAKDL